MPTQRKSAKSSKKSSGKSTSSSSKSGSKSRSSSRSTQSSRRGSQSSGGKSQSSRSGAKSSRSSAGKRATGSRRSKAPNALELLTQDHREVQKMFRKAERMESGDRQLQEIVETACAALTLHAQIEEQLVYPAIKEQDEDAFQEALIEHDSAKQLIAQLESMGARDERYKATFKVLGEYVNHHIEEEESTVFRAARRAKLDMEALGEQILMIKEGGAGEMGEEASAGEGSSRSGSRSGRGASGSTRSRNSRSSRGGKGSGDSRSSGDDSQAALDDETESGATSSRSGGDSSEDSERPGRGGRRAAAGRDADDGDEIDVETPGGSSRYDTH